MANQIPHKAKSRRVSCGERTDFGVVDPAEAVGLHHSVPDAPDENDQDNALQITSEKPAQATTRKIGAIMKRQRKRSNNARSPYARIIPGR